jgi:hypothetical protein
LPSGETIWAYVDQVDDIADGAGHDVNLSDSAATAVEGLLDTVRGVATSVRMALVDIQPDEVAVEFGVELTAKSGRIVSALAEAGGMAALKLTLTWKREVDPKS